MLTDIFATALEKHVIKDIMKDKCNTGDTP